MFILVVGINVKFNKTLQTEAARLPVPRHKAAREKSLEAQMRSHEQDIVSKRYMIAMKTHRTCFVNLFVM